MNLKTFTLAYIIGLTSFGAMAVGSLALDAGTNQLVGTWSQDVPLTELIDSTGWSYKAFGATEFVPLGIGSDDASIVKGTTKLDLNTSGGELKLAFTNGVGAALAIPTTGAYEYSVDTTFQFMKDWPTTLLDELQTSGAKTAVFAMANDPDDETQGAKLIVAQGGAYVGSGVSTAAGFAYVQLPAALQTGTSYRVTIRLKGGRDSVDYNASSYAVTLFKILVDGVEYPVYDYDGIAVGSQVGFSGSETDLSVMGTGAGNWLMAACFNDAYLGTLDGVDVIASASFQGTGTLDNMTLSTYSDPVTSSWTLAIVGNGGVSLGETPVSEGIITAGTYFVHPTSGHALASVATNGIVIAVYNGIFVLDAATGLDTVTVSFRPAVWTLAPYSQGVVQDSHGNLVGFGVVPAGSYAVIPDLGYTVDNIINASASAVTGESFYLGDLTKDETVTVIFREAVWTLEVSGGGEVKDFAGQTVSNGPLPKGTYMVVPAAGYKYTGVYGASSGTASEFTLGNSYRTDRTVSVYFVQKTAIDTPASRDLATTTLLADKTAWITATSGRTTKFDAWVSANSITFQTMNTSNAINAFLCNVGLNETAGLLDIAEVTVNGTTLTAKVFVGAITVDTGENALLVNGTPAAYIGTTLGSMTANGEEHITLSEKDVDGFVTLTITGMPEGTSGFVKFAIE